jgi:hypothetical protein
MVARRTVDGIVEATKEIGGNVDDAAKVAIGGAIEAAASIGNTAVAAVREVLIGALGAVKDIAGAALPKTEPTTRATPSEKRDRSI